MSWLFSRAMIEAYENSHSSQGRVAAFSEATSSDGEPCAQLNVMPTQRPFWRNDKTMEPSRLSRFGPTCAVLTADRGAELLTSFLAASRARTSASPATAMAWRANAPASGASSRGWFATFDRATSSWRTAQCSLLGDSESFSETWPRWGSMRNGASYLRPTPALPICESASGLWPTPTTDSASDRSKRYAQGGMPLAAAVKLWPTPTSTLGTNGGMVTPSKAREGGTLIEALSARTQWPTPCARDYRHPGKSRMERTGSKAGEVLPQIVGGPLNPDWTEWLMGWPIGWTDSKPSGTDRFREWQQQHGDF